MIRSILFGITLLFASFFSSPLIINSASAQQNFVVQLTRDNQHHGQRRTFLQIDKVLDDIGEQKLHIEVIAYEDGIHALLANNKETKQLLTKLANRGVIFKACRISMKSWKLSEDDFPLEVQFVDAGAPEMIRLQMNHYKYWRP